MIFERTSEVFRIDAIFYLFQDGCKRSSVFIFVLLRQLLNLSAPHCLLLLLNADASLPLVSTVAWMSLPSHSTVHIRGLPFPPSMIH